MSNFASEVTTLAEKHNLQPYETAAQLGMVIVAITRHYAEENGRDARDGLEIFIKAMREEMGEQLS